MTDVSNRTTLVTLYQAGQGKSTQETSLYKLVYTNFS